MWSRASRSDYNCAVTRRLVTLSLFLLLGCSQVEQQTLLPWFRIRTSRPHETGIFSLGSARTDYFVKTHGWWKRLDVYGGVAVALNPETVIFYSNGQAQIIRRGETTWTPVCGPSMSFATIARRAEAVDCVQTLSGPLGVAKKIRWRRVTATGRIVNDDTFDVEGTDRVFLNPTVKFYDDNDAPYFVTIHDWPFTSPQCAVVTADHQSIRSPENMSAADCSNAALWSKVLQHRLH